MDLLILGMILLTGSAAVSTLTSLSPRVSWQGSPDSHAGLRTLLGYLVLFLATRSVCRDVADGRRILAGAVTAAVLAAGYGLLQAAGLDPIAWDDVADFAGHGRPFGTLGHAILLSAYLAMALPLLAGFAADAAQGRRWKTVAALAAAGTLMLAVVFLGLSRAAWLAAAVSLTLLALLWRRGANTDPTRAQPQVIRRLSRRSRGLVLLVALSPCLLVCVWPGPAGARFRSGFAERVRRLEDTSGRAFIWRASWQLFGDRPWLGWGPDTLYLAFGRHRPAGYADVEWNARPTRAHNVVLHILATQGVVGALALLVLSAGLARSAVRAWRAATAQDRYFVAAVIGALIAFLVAIEFGFVVTACGSLFAVLAGLLSAWAAQRSDSPPRAREESGDRLWTRGWYVALAAAVAAVLWVEVAAPLAASCACRRGDIVVARDAETARVHYEQAAALDPGNDRYPVRLAGTLQRLADHAATPQARARQLALARTALERATVLVPADAYHLANRARVLTEEAQHGSAPAGPVFAAWEAALALDPVNAWFLAEAARSALVLGQAERVRAWAGRALQLYPRFGPPQAHLGGQALRDGRFAEAIAHLSKAIQADWHEDTEGSDHARAALAASYLGLGNPLLARHFADEVVQSRPEWPAAHFLLGQALEGEGRRTEAAAEYRQTLILDPRYTPAQAAWSRLRQAPQAKPPAPRR